MSTEATVARLMALADAYAVALAKDGTGDVSIKQDAAYAALEAAMREALDLGEPVGWQFRWEDCDSWTNTDVEPAPSVSKYMQVRAVYAPKAKP